MNTLTFTDLTDEELSQVNGGGISSYQAGKYVGYGIDIAIGAAIVFFL